MTEVVRNGLLARIRISRRLLVVLLIVLVSAVGGTGAMGVFALNSLNDRQAGSLGAIRVLGQTLDSARLAQIYFGLQMQELASGVLAPPGDPRRDGHLQAFEEHSQTVRAMIGQARALTLNQARLMTQVASDTLAVEVAAEAGAIGGLLQDHGALQKLFRASFDRGGDPAAALPASDYEALRTRSDLFNAKLNSVVDDLLNTSVRLRNEVEQEGDRLFRLNLWIFSAVSALSMLLICVLLLFEYVMRIKTQRKTIEYWAKP